MPSKKPEVKEPKKVPVSVKAAEAKKEAAPAGKKEKSRKAHAMPPVIRNNHPCRPHAFQDRVYGEQMRVMNACMDKTKGLAHRCTVCGQVF